VSWPVYTETFIRRRSLAAGTWNWTVPAGKRAIVKSVVVVQTGATAGLAEILINNVACHIVQVPAAASASALELLAVAYAGQVVGAYASQANFDITVSGWLLSDVGALSSDIPAPTWDFEVGAEALPHAA